MLDHAELKGQLEALLIVAESPISVVALATAVDQPTAKVKTALDELRADYDGERGTPERGFELREIAGGYRFYVRPKFDELVASFVHDEAAQKLSQAALETLAVVAYKQPISRGAIASIRAVNVDSVVRNLVNRGFITEVGSDPVTGAILYGTSAELLEHLGISSIAELPPIAPLLEDGAEGFESENIGL